jgi:hemolysin activation/secretion protein
MLLLAAAFPIPAQAQVAPPPPPTREQIERPDTNQQRAPGVHVERGNALQPGPCPLRDSPLRTSITGVDFTGPGGAELPAVIRTAVARVIIPQGDRPIAVVCDIRDEANAELRRDGYIAAVQVPPQRISGGRLRLEVVTGRLVDVRMRGDAPPFRGQIAAAAERLKALQPLNQFEAERILLLASDMPGVDVRLTLAPAGTVPGDLVGELTIFFQPYRLLANVNNFGSRQLGRYSLYARGEVYGLTRSSDLSYVAASTTTDFDEQQVVQVGHAFGLGDSGATLGGDLAYAWSRPDLSELDPDDILRLRSRSLIARIEGMVPLVRSRRTTTSLRGGLEFLQQRTTSSFGLITRDRLRVAFVRAETGFREPLSDGTDAFSLRGALELRKGLDIFGASDRYSLLASHFEGDPEAFVLRGEAGGVLRLPSVFSLAIDAEGQWANHPLLNFEEYSVGNYTIGRGYDPGAITADRAIAIRPELRARVVDRPRFKLELFGFHDSIWLWNLDSFSTEHGRHLGSWGAGARAAIAPYFLAEATYAKPVDRPFINGRKPPARLLVSMTALFSPGGH